MSALRRYVDRPDQRRGSRHIYLFTGGNGHAGCCGRQGLWDSAAILFVIWTALLLYHVMNKAGGYEALRQGIVSFSCNELFIVVALG